MHRQRDLQARFCERGEDGMMARPHQTIYGEPGLEIVG